MTALRSTRPRGLRKALLLFIVIGLSQSILAQEKGPLIQNRLAKEELQLARTPSLYFIIYLNSKMIALKSRGMTLREWKIDGLHAWGYPPPPEALTLQKKSTLFPPKRAKIKPAANEEEAAAFEPDALELKDMPSRFTLFLSGGMRVYVRARVRGFFPRLGSLGHFFAWYVGAPLTNLFFEMRKKPFAALDIMLAGEEDARALYWTFPDGLKGLIYPL
ncbi:MAG: hypothetical protein WAU81_11765 [Candidatus Aminicenantales bacterium]